MNTFERCQEESPPSLLGPIGQTLHEPALGLELVKGGVSVKGTRYDLPLGMMKISKHCSLMFTQREVGHIGYISCWQVFTSLE